MLGSLCGLLEINLITVCCSYYYYYYCYYILIFFFDIVIALLLAFVAIPNDTGSVYPGHTYPLTEYDNPILRVDQRNDSKPLSSLSLYVLLLIITIHSCYSISDMYYGGHARVLVKSFEEEAKHKPRPFRDTKENNKNKNKNKRNPLVVCYFGDHLENDIVITKQYPFLNTYAFIHYYSI